MENIERNKIEVTVQDMAKKIAAEREEDKKRFPIIEGRQIEVFGIQRSGGHYPLGTALTNIGWMKRNIEIMKLAYVGWENNDIAIDSFCLVMNEGFDKLEVFIEEIENSIELANKKN